MKSDLKISRLLSYNAVVSNEKAEEKAKTDTTVMASEDEEWEPLTEVDMKLLQARRERSSLGICCLKN